MLMSDILDMALTKEGSLYRWAAKGPDRFDCSGLVTWALYEASKHVIDWRETFNAERLHAACQILDEVTPTPKGALVFYGSPSLVNHVVIYCGDQDSFSGVSRVFGACGGNHTTIDDETAQKQNAKVKFKPSMMYRPDFRGVGVLPILINL